MTLTFSPKLSFTWAKQWNGPGCKTAARVISLRYNWPWCSDSAHVTLRMAHENGCDHYTTLSLYLDSNRIKVDLQPTLYWRKTRQAKALERLMLAAVERDLNRPPEPLPFEREMRRAQARALAA